MEVKLKVVDMKTCQTAMVNNTITRAMICAGGVKNKDSCQVSERFWAALNFEPFSDIKP